MKTLALSSALRSGNPWRYGELCECVDVGDGEWEFLDNGGEVVAGGWGYMPALYEVLDRCDTIADHLLDFAAVQAGERERHGDPARSLALVGALVDQIDPFAGVRVSGNVLHTRDEIEIGFHAEDGEDAAERVGSLIRLLPEVQRHLTEYSDWWAAREKVQRFSREVA